MAALSTAGNAILEETKAHTVTGDRDWPTSDMYAGAKQLAMDHAWKTPKGARVWHRVLLLL